MSFFMKKDIFHIRWRGPIDLRIGRDDTGSIPSILRASGTPVAPPATDLVGSRAPPAPPERPGGGYPGYSQTMDFQRFSRIFKDFLPIQADGVPVAPEEREVPESQRDWSPGTPQASRRPAAC